MLGAIIGDTVGSIYEFNNHRSKDFKLFQKNMFFTDDTVMTCAVANSLITRKGDNIAKCLREYGMFYPFKGYGGSFRMWLIDKNMGAYNSFGNGAAMRISPVAWYAKTEEEVKELSKKVTECTHNHEEGLKGAEVTAMCIFKALHQTKKDKQEIYDYVVSMYPEIADFKYKELVKNYRFNETCQDTVPQAIYCFLISDSFEDCLRTSVSIGGDTDTLLAISCAIAEAYYGIPKDIKKEILKYFTARDSEFVLTSKYSKSTLNYSIN